MTKKKNIDFDEIKVSGKTLSIVAAIILGIAILVLLVLAYGTNTKAGNKIAATISSVVPFPEAIIDYKYFILSKDVESNLSSMKQFYLTQDLSQTGLRVDFSTPDGQKRLEIKRKEILQKMIEDKAIELLANQKGISITSAQVDKAVTQKLQEFGTADQVKKDLIKNYGWTIEDFKSKVVLPGMYKDALIGYFNENEGLNTNAKDKAQQAKSELDGGKDFADLVKVYSEGSSKDKAGELGWVKKDQMLPELQEALFSSKQFKNGTLVESSIGYHIVEVENRKSENGSDLLQLKQIFIAKYTFADWLNDQMKKMNIVVPASGFKWNSKDGIVDFSDAKMTEFEKQSRESVQGDASIMF